MSPDNLKLLSPKRIAAITEWHKRLAASYEKNATDETIQAAGLGGIGVLLDDTADLLAHVNAQRATTEALLRELFALPDSRLDEVPLMVLEAAHKMGIKLRD